MGVTGVDTHVYSNFVYEVQFFFVNHTFHQFLLNFTKNSYQKGYILLRVKMVTKPVKFTLTPYLLSVSHIGLNPLR